MSVFFLSLSVFFFFLSLLLVFKALKGGWEEERGSSVRDKPGVCHEELSSSPPGKKSSFAYARSYWGISAQQLGLLSSLLIIH